MFLVHLFFVCFPFSPLCDCPDSGLFPCPNFALALFSPPARPTTCVKAPTEVVESGRLAAVLGAFQKLLSSKAHDHEGFYILNAIAERLPLAAFAPFLTQIWQLVFSRLQHARTAKLARAVSVFLSLFVAKHGLQSVTESIDRVQAGLFPMLLDTVWLPAAGQISGDVEKKLCAVALTRVLVESPQLMADGAAALWQRVLAAVMKIFEAAAGDEAGGQGGGGGAVEAEEPDVEEPVGYTAAYQQLANASRPEADPLPEVRSPGVELASALHRLSATVPGKLAPRIEAALLPHAKAALQGYLAQAGNLVIS